METIIQESVKKTDNGRKLVEEKFPSEKGWKNVNLYGSVWRCNRWEKNDTSVVIVESYFVTITPDGLEIK
jgi:hypothetical protein